MTGREERHDNNLEMFKKKQKNIDWKILEQQKTFQIDSKNDVYKIKK